MNILRVVFMATASATLFMAANLASAQSTTGLSGNAPQSAGSTPQSPDNETLGEIVVTAERRESRLVDVPMTVSVLSGTQLIESGVYDTPALQTVTAGLQLPYFGAFMAPALRGVSSNATNSGISSNVAFYVDGIYQASQVGQLMQLPDVQDIEILKGPQGTLYGQNAEGGAIVINTLAPQFTYQGRVSASYGNYDDLRLLGYETGPITDVLAQSVAVDYETHDGFRTSFLTGQHDSGLNEYLVRTKLLFKPSDSASITATANYSWNSDSGTFTGIPWHNLTVTSRIDPALVEGVNSDQFTVEPERLNTVQSFGVSLKGEFEFVPGKMTWIAAYSDVHADVSADTDYSAANISQAVNTERDQNIIEEIDFDSKRFGLFEFTTGLFYQHVKDTLVPEVFDDWTLSPTFSPIPVTVWPSSPTNTSAAQHYQVYGVQPTTRDIFAVYFDTNFAVTSNLILTGGARYDTDTMHAYFNRSFSSSDQQVTELNYSPQTWSNISPRFTARYNLTHDSNVYFSYAEGFKSGALNAYGLTSPPVSPEKLHSYELGYKAAVHDLLTLSVAAFHYNYDDKQESSYVPPVTILQNAASAKINGVDFDATLAVTRTLSLSTSLEWLHAKYDSFPNAEVYVPNPATGGLSSYTDNLSGQQMERAPKFSGIIRGDYHLETSVGRFNAFASVYHTSSILEDENGLITQPAYTLLNMELGYSPLSVPSLKLILWGENLTDAVYIKGILETNYAAGVVFEPRRQFGGRAEYKF